MQQGTLSIRLMGGFSVSTDAGLIAFPSSGRLRVLLALLLLPDASGWERAQLALRLWPDSTPGQGRTNLRRELHRLVRLDPAIECRLSSRGSRLQWQWMTGDYFDVGSFRANYELISRCGSPSECQGAFLACIEHTRGDFMPGLDDEWIQRQRQALDAQRRSALRHVLRIAAENGDAEQIIQAATHLLHDDACDERAAMTLIRLHQARGETALAMRVYRGTEQALARDLGIAPSLELRSAFEALRSAPLSTHSQTLLRVPRSSASDAARK
ncbi:MAG: bacterial transcriptional activator domain-containing protein [Burkholderiaceae bacterium]